jgi:putative ATP-binding cassette transporter
MRLFTEFTQKAPNRVFLSVLLGALAGVCYTALIPLVLNSIAPVDPRFPEINDGIETVWSVKVLHVKQAALFLVICSVILVSRACSEIILVRVAAEWVRDFRIRYYERISRAPITALERVGLSKLAISINIDAPRMVLGARALPGLLVNLVTLIGMLAFLLYINSDVFWLVMVAILFGIAAYQLPMMLGGRILMKSRHVHDHLQRSVQGLIQGAKELKLNLVKRDAFFARSLLAHEDEIMAHDKKALSIIRATMSFGELLSFVVIGLVSFVFINYHQVSAEELVGVIMALLYVVGPIGVILTTIPQLTVAHVSMRKVDQLLAEIPVEGVSQEIVPIPDWQEISFSAVTYRYVSESGDSSFEVGPIDLSIKKGEVAFLVGANGSGKSTLSKLLTLHYLPDSGVIRFSGNVVAQDNLTSYRQGICAIYSDYYLFDSLMTELTDELTATANRYLQALRLSGKVSIVNGQFSTLALSDGQRRRLALLVAVLEDKELYLFDEWAADQDPVFKEVFYAQILPELRDRGKAVLVISHDDRFFHVADRLLVMEQGKLKDSTGHLARLPGDGVRAPAVPFFTVS